MLEAAGVATDDFGYYSWNIRMMLIAFLLFLSNQLASMMNQGGALTLRRPMPRGVFDEPCFSIRIIEVWKVNRNYLR
jgi:hypothetical protein